MKAHNPFVSDLTGNIQAVLTAGNNSVKVTDCEVGDTVTLIFGVYEVQMKGGRKQFVKQRDLSAIERRFLGQDVKVQKRVDCEIW